MKPDDGRTSAWPVLDDGIRAAFEAVMRDGSWGRYHGPHCDQLSDELRTLCQTEHAILCSSGTCAMELAMRALSVGPGDEVILSAYDFKSNFINVRQLGATPVLVDVLPGVPVIDIDRISDAITGKTRAIVVSHLHGCLAPMSQLRQLADDRGVSLIEDACQCPGAIVDGRPAGTFGHAGILSFGGSKLLTAGRGGCVLTSSAMVAQRIQLHTFRGNDAYPLSEMQAAVLVPQLQTLHQRNEIRRQSAEQLATVLLHSNLFRVRNYPMVPTQEPAIQNVPVYYKMAILLNGTPESRDQITELAQRMGIPLDAAFPGLHRIHGRTTFRASGDLHHATELHSLLCGLHHTALLKPADAVQELGNRFLALEADCLKEGWLQKL